MSYKEWKRKFAGNKRDNLREVLASGKIKSGQNTEFVKKSETRRALEESNVEYRKVKLFDKELSVQEIINRVGGGDMTDGSCSSLAFAYAGNRNGLDVLDFRGGSSQLIFSQDKNIKEITKLAGGKIINNFNDYKAVKELLKFVMEGKEYYLATGRHAAVIRKIEGHYEYLELQSSVKNGWFRLNDESLKRRFKCQKTHTVYGMKVEFANMLIDMESLKQFDEFEILLGYINTAAGSQLKGRNGRVK